LLHSICDSFEYFWKLTALPFVCHFLLTHSLTRSLAADRVLCDDDQQQWLLIDLQTN
jgi:hypothetical protein